jgi:hypothetical protein
MPNITALERITRFINSEKNVKQMKKWSQRFKFANLTSDLDNRNHYLKRLMKQVRAILVIVSGDDVVEMLKGSCFCFEHFKNI